MDEDTPDLLTTARTLATDAACTEVLRAWRGRGIHAILLKGPTTAEWLYPGEARGYTDSDLLVAPERVMDAATMLAELGFAPAQEHVSLHAHPWMRASDSATIDLHVTIWGPSRSPQAVWAELQHWTVSYQLGPIETRALSIPARALQIALHAAQHRERPRRPADLRRAIAQASLADWQAAERLADRLWALLPMAQGLQLEPAGQTLLAQLPLARAATLSEYQQAPLAVGFTRIANARGLRAKAAVIATAVQYGPGAPGATGEAPPRRLGLLAAYARRAVWLLARAPRTAISMRRASVRERRHR